MNRASQLIVFVALIAATCSAQSASASPCRTIGIVSENPHLPAKFLRAHLTFHVALQEAYFSFLEESLAETNADIVVRVRPIAPDEVFRLAVRISHRATGETREALHSEVNREAKTRVAQDVARAILALCPTQRFQQVIATAQREPVAVTATVAAEAPAPAPACTLTPVHELSLYSPTSSLDERDLRSAIAKDPLARKLDVRAELAPANGAQVSIKRRLGTSYWSFSVTTPEGAFCQRDLFILKDEDAPKRLSRAILLAVGNSQGKLLVNDDALPRPRAFKVKAFGGLASVKQDNDLFLALSGKELLITTTAGFEVTRIPASALQDVSTNDYKPSLHSDEGFPLPEKLGTEPMTATAVMLAITAYAIVNHIGSFGMNLFREEHFLDLAWKDGDDVKRASFKVRGRDTKALRADLEALVEAAQMFPPVRRPSGALLATER